MAEFRIEFGERIGPKSKRVRPDEPWTAGYTMAELDLVQEKYDLVFPPDLVALLLDRRPIDAHDWRTDEVAIRQLLEWPLEGLYFDVENNNLWWPEWGDKPDTADARKEVLRSAISRAPKLIPIYSHRYLPAEPHESGNPVFSVYQSDVIYYGANLANYFEREFHLKDHQPLRGPIRFIPFWSELVERFGQSTRPTRSNEK